MTNPTINSKYKSILLGTILAVFTAGNAAAYQGEMDAGFDAPFEKSFSGKHKRHHHKMMAKILGLSDEQKAEMKAIRQQAKQEATTIKASLAEYKTKVKAIIQADEFDQASFENLHAEYQQNFAQLALLRAKTKHSMRQVLTAEQQEKWQEFKPMRKRR